MNIGELAKEEAGRPVVGKDVVERMFNIFADFDNAHAWAHREVLALDYNTPHQYCREGKYEEVYDLLGQLEYGVFN